MAVPFDYPTGNFTSFSDLLNHTDSLTGGLYGTLFLVAVFFVSFMTSKTVKDSAAFIFASFLTLVIAIFLRFASLIGDGVLYLCVAIFITAGVWNYIKK